MLPKNSKCKMETKITNEEIRKMGSKRNIIQRIKERKLIFRHIIM